MTKYQNFINFKNFFSLFLNYCKLKFWSKNYLTSKYLKFWMFVFQILINYLKREFLKTKTLIKSHLVNHIQVDS